MIYKPKSIAMILEQILNRAIYTRYFGYEHVMCLSACLNRRPIHTFKVSLLSYLILNKPNNQFYKRRRRYTDRSLLLMTDAESSSSNDCNSVSAPLPNT